MIQTWRCVDNTSLGDFPKEKLLLGGWRPLEGILLKPDWLTSCAKDALAQPHDCIRIQTISTSMQCWKKSPKVQACLAFAFGSGWHKLQGILQSWFHPKSRSTKMLWTKKKLWIEDRAGLRTVFLSCEAGLTSGLWGLLYPHKLKKSSQKRNEKKTHTHAS